MAVADSEVEIRIRQRSAAQRQLDALEDILLLALNEEALHLAGELVNRGAIPQRAKEDALHIALATVHGMDFLLTWNCRHIANAKMRARIMAVLLSLGYEAPVICTPEELMGE